MPGQSEALLVLESAKSFRKPSLIKLWKVVEAGLRHVLFLFSLKLLNVEVIARFAV